MIWQQKPLSTIARNTNLERSNNAVRRAFDVCALDPPAINSSGGVCNLREVAGKEFEVDKVLGYIAAHMEDRFYCPEPSYHGKPLDLLEVESKIDDLEARYIRLTDVEPMPQEELEELDDEIKQLTKIRNRIWNNWQQSISNLRKEQVTQ